MTTTLLVLGASGFVGRNLFAHGPYEVDGHPVRLVEPAAGLDLVDAGAVAALVAAVRPDWLLHLAAVSHVPQSFREPRRTLEVNVIGTLNVLMALRDAAFRGRMIYVSSGDVYGRVDDDDLPVTEAHLPRPRSPYAVSKLAAEALCAQWAITEGLDVLIARPFNHIGPGQGDQFVVSGFARQVNAIAHGGAEPVVEVGDIDVTRDFLDVRDVIAAYFRLFARGRAGETYNVCSGVERSVRQVLERLLELAGVHATTRAASGRMRPAEQRRMRGSSARLQRDTGWSPTVDLDDSLRAILAYWENERCHARP
jgi:GDP-4-dehydro-6-deoxy-D-mannose reductase